jgi:ferredoxin
MLCTTACPNDAFIFSQFDAESLCFSADSTELVVISCHRQSRIYPEERLVPCLGGISTEHLLALNMYGKSTLAFNVSACTGCENYSGVEEFLHRLARLKQNRGSVYKRTSIVITDQKEIVVFDQSARRSFLSGLKETVYQTLGSQFSFHSDRSSPAARTGRRIPARVQIKKHLMQKVAPEDRKALSRLINHQLTINKNCNLCPLCKGICPTGALKVAQTEGKKELTFDGTLCSGCGLCVAFCKQNALSLEEPDTWIMTAGARCQPESSERLLPMAEYPAEQSENEIA